MNNKHIEIVKPAPYNGTYKRRRFLISESDRGRRESGKCDRDEGRAAPFALLGAGAGSMSQYFLMAAGTAGNCLLS